MKHHIVLASVKLKASTVATIIDSRIYTLMKHIKVWPINNNFF